jgi:hypothetical protein
MEREHFEDINLDVRFVLKYVLKSRLAVYGLDSSSSGQSGFCERCNGPLCSVKFDEFHDLVD